MMATVLFGGMMSIPFARPLFDAWRKTFGTDPQKEIRDRFPEWVRDIVTYGVPAAVGVNVGGSLEIGNIDTGNPLKFIIGVPWSEGESVGRAAKAYKSGQPMRAIEEMAPSVVKNPMSAWRLFDQGQYSISGKPINLPGEIGPRKITALEAVGKAFGFQPVSSTKARDATDALNDLKEFVETKKTEWANRYVNAYNKNDLEAMGRVRQEVADWNERWMKQGQTEFTIILRDAVRNRLKPYQMPRRFRGISREYAEEYQ
jgi:hypothetical protein